MKKQNLLLLADAYKYAHHKLYIPGTTKIYSYLESRGGVFPETVFYGLQYFLKAYLEGKAFTQDDIDEADETLTAVFGRKDVFNKVIFEYILKVHNGKLPVRIKAVPEGSVVPVHNVLMTIENTDPKCYWLTNFLETLLMQVWYPSTVATLSREVRKVVEQYFEATVDDNAKSAIDFVLNDFGFRGVSSVESAALGGSAHLINFMGSDTVYASTFARKYYNAQKVYGLSVPATEHSIMTLLGKKEESRIFQHVLNSYPEGIIACVSDSYDIFNAVANLWGTEFKQQILDRKGTLVIRPDSGDPVKTLAKVFEILFAKFGFSVNSKGYKLLPPQVRVIQGDGIDISSIPLIYGSLKQNRISAENLVLGMGGALLQKVNRDTQKFALKCSYAEINGDWVNVKKQPVELNADGELVKSFKTSKAGKLKLVKVADRYQTTDVYSNHYDDELQTVFENGTITKQHSFEQVRERAQIRSLHFA
ncbi:MAG TPA: nicotinate phosphoribosyltransferase [Ohtaekwangia sp.]|nr:nicotinate phosphoribosyltransferase [Ohtaekwangia sp.]